MDHHTEPTHRAQSGLCVRISGFGRTLHQTEIDEEEQLPLNAGDILIYSYHRMLKNEVKQSKCEKHWADPSVWTSFMGTLWSWHYANAAGCWHCRHGLDTVWLVLCCSLAWFCCIVSFSNSNKACCLPCDWMWGEFYQRKPAGTHEFAATDLNYPVVNERWGNTWSFKPHTEESWKCFRWGQFQKQLGVAVRNVKLILWY